MPIAVLKHEMGFLLLQIYLKELAVAYIERTQEGLAREHIKRKYNTIWAIIAHQLQPRTKPLMRPTRQDKLKRITAAILGIDIQLIDLSKAQYRKSRRAKIQEAFKKQQKREQGKYQSILTHSTTAQAKPQSKVFKRYARLIKIKSTINILLRTEHIGLNRYLYY